MAVYFLSDLHLGAPYFPDSKEAEKRVVDFLESIRKDAEAIYLLGDVLDYWYEYRYVVPKGYVRFFGKLAELVDSGVKITWMLGNHDIWLFDYLPKEIGLRVVDGPITEEINGKKFLLAHGDGLGKVPRTFRILRALFRNRICRWLYAGIHPRWTVPFANSWSRHSRESHSEDGAVTTPERPEINPYLARSIQNLRDYSLRHHATHPEISHYIYGHLHHPHHSHLLPETGDTTAESKEDSKTGTPTFTILGDWISNFTYARFDGDTLSLQKL